MLRARHSKLRCVYAVSFCSCRLLAERKAHAIYPDSQDRAKVGRAGCYVQVSDPSCSDYDKRTPL